MAVKWFAYAKNPAACYHIESQASGLLSHLISEAQQRKKEGTETPLMGHMTSDVGFNTVVFAWDLMCQPDRPLLCLPYAWGLKALLEESAAARRGKQKCFKF